MPDESLCQSFIFRFAFQRWRIGLDLNFFRRPELVEVGSEFDKSCEEFVVTGLRYEHLTPPTPDMDYIPLHVVVSDRLVYVLLVCLKISFVSYEENEPT